MAEHKHPPEGRTVIRGARVLDPAAGALTDDTVVVVEGDRIVDVGRGAAPVAADRVLDAQGLVVVPGLIDCHVHVTVVTTDVWGMAEWSPAYVTARAAGVLRGMLARGFTTVRDLGGCDYGLAQAVAEGYLEGPRIVYGGKMLSQTGGAGEWRGRGRTVYDPHYNCPSLAWICDGVTAVRRAAREEIRRGAHHLKVYLSGAVDAPSDRIDQTQFADDEIRAAVEEAGAAGIYVAGHAYTARAVNRGLRLGVRTIEHGNLIDATSPPLFLEHGAFYVPTLATYDALRRHGEALGMPPEAMAKLPPVLEGGLRALELAHRAGVPIAYGTDLLAAMHAEQAMEFRLLGEVQPPADAIRAATTVAARLLGREGEMGVVAPGARADLILVDGTPLDDLAVLAEPQRHLRLVMQGGRVVRQGPAA